MTDPGQETVGQSPVGRAVSTSVRGNSTAFGFSIMITVSFGMLWHLRGEPTVPEMLLFGAAAALGVALLEGTLTRGFRARAEQAPPEVRMLGTAMNFVSVSAGVAAALGVGELMDGLPVWPAGAFAAALTYIIAESIEILIAEEVQAARGDPAAESGGES